LQNRAVAECAGYAGCQLVPVKKRAIGDFQVRDLERVPYPVYANVAARHTEISCSERRQVDVYSTAGNSASQDNGRGDQRNRNDVVRIDYPQKEPGTVVEIARTPAQVNRAVLLAVDEIRADGLVANDMRQDATALRTVKLSFLVGCFAIDTHSAHG